MTGAGNQEHAETLGLGLSIISAAQPWPELPMHMERFLDLTFLVVRRDKAQVTECWCPDEVVKKRLMALGWPIESPLDAGVRRNTLIFYCKR